MNVGEPIKYEIHFLKGFQYLLTNELVGKATALFDKKAALIN